MKKNLARGMGEILHIALHIHVSYIHVCVGPIGLILSSSIHKLQ